MIVADFKGPAGVSIAHCRQSVRFVSHVSVVSVKTPYLRGVVRPITLPGWTVIGALNTVLSLVVYFSVVVVPALTVELMAALKVAVPQTVGSPLT